MGTLYIDRKEFHVKLDGDALALYANGEREGIVPINPLDRVIMVGNIAVETNVLNRLAGDGISVLFLSGKQNKFCGMLHGKLHNNGLLRVRQYEKSAGRNTPLTPSPLERGGGVCDKGGFSEQFVIDIVKRKIEGQRDLLLHIREQRPDLRLRMMAALQVYDRILEEIKKPDIEMETLRGFEGGASATYFGAFTEAFPDSLEFTGRNRRPPEDPVNAVLSLCYTLVHFDIVREIEVIGLDPVIGFYHQFDYGRESLACDLIEPYRPMIDRFVWEIFRERAFTSRDFAMNDERPGCYLKKDSRKRFYPMYEEWVQNTRPLWIEDVRGLARRIMDGQDIIYKPDQ